MEKDISLDSFSGSLTNNNGKKSETPIAIELAKKQRDISVAEFFEKNRHLLGFDNKKKALLTTIKEAVDNSLDACEEADILPEIVVEIIDMSTSEIPDRFKIIVEDNGPGIVKEQIPSIFAKLLYGSKFHRLKQSRGQQGLGISASVMYAQLTTGKPAKIISKISPSHPAHYVELMLDTATNKPKILKTEIVEWSKDHGTKVEIDLEGSYAKGSQSVDEYLRNTAIVNPHTTIIYQPSSGSQIMFIRATEEKPAQPKEIKPHPYGIELGTFLKMLERTEYRTLQAFLTNEFSRVGAGTAKEICENSATLPTTPPKKISREMAEKIVEGIKKTKIMNPPTDCIVPIGKELIEKGIKKEIHAEFYASATRPPFVYRGNPFVIEAALAYGGNLPAEDSMKILRFANRVPLLYQQGACAITSSITKTNWRQYGLKQSSNSVPIGPCVIIVHMGSVWVPYTSEAKEAIAHYPEIIKEIKLALQECGRELGKYLNKKRRVNQELKKVDYITKYLPHVGIALQELLKLDDKEKARLEENLKEILESTRDIPTLESADNGEIEDSEGMGFSVGDDNDSDDDSPDDDNSGDDSDEEPEDDSEGGEDNE
ncbi:MAG: DNA topoisomerase VI subunit B [archaeon]